MAKQKGTARKNPLQKCLNETNGIGEPATKDKQLWYIAKNMAKSAEVETVRLKYTSKNLKNFFTTIRIPWR